MRNIDIILLCAISALAGFFVSNFLNSESNFYYLFNYSNTSNTVERTLLQITPIPILRTTKNSGIIKNVVQVESFEEREKQMFVQGCGKSPSIQNYTWNVFKEKVLKDNVIYQTVQTDPGKFDGQGWGNTELYINELIENVGRDTNDTEIRIIEVGAWKGRSARNAAAACRNFTARTNRACYLLSIDTWLASSEHYESMLPDMPTNTYIADLFNTFLNNIKVKAMEDIIYPLRLPSNIAVHVLHCFRVDAHIIFVDGDHDYKPVLRDIETFYPLVKKNGIIWGDDMYWAGVAKAVNEYKNYKGDRLQFWQRQQYWFFKKLKEEPKFFVGGS